jgi:hypothetical protein
MKKNKKKSDFLPPKFVESENHKADTFNKYIQKSNKNFNKNKRGQ